MTTLTLVFDNRAVDGRPAALFLRALCDRLESGEGL
jgi:pyruvate/2-oxoglutarate dehydrogenase complex dihydrolipoamide acyltransferase (E2) component